LENIAILRNNVLLGIEQRTTFDTIPLTIWNLQPQDYELEIFASNIASMYLEDIVANTRELIATGDTLRHRFTNAIANSPKDSSVRFRLLFAAAPPPPPNNCGGGRGHHQPRRHRHDHKKLKLYPNPAVGNYLNIEMQHVPEGRYKVTLVGAFQSATYELIHHDNNTERIDIAALPQGKYYLMIEDEEGWKETRQIEIL